MNRYLDCSRSAWYSLLFVLPLWALYEVLATALNVGQQQQITNGADFLLRQLMGVVGVQGRLASTVLLAVVASIWVFRADSAHRKQGIHPTYFLGMLAESGVYALLFGGVVVYVMRLLMPDFLLTLQIGGAPSLSVPQQFMSSLGAGVYEELLFRVIIMGGMAWLGTRFLRMKPGAALLIAMVVSSFLFSTFHYVGSMADQFRIASFSFRFFSGMLLAVLYRVRGFGIAAYTHALYDILLVVQGVQ